MVLILLFAHVPEPMKRKSFLADYLGLGNNSLGGSLRQRAGYAAALPMTGVWSFLARVVATL